MGKTVFVLGAGASFEVGLPIGDELKTKIARLLDISMSDFGRQSSGDALVLEALQQHCSATKESLHDYVNAARAIRDSMPLAPSIDNFIDVHRGDMRIELCGKLAIIRSILSAEKSSLLSVNNNNPSNTIKFADLGKTWFNGFWQVVSANCNFDEFRKRIETIGVVSFNYDRCFEHYLHHAIQIYYRVPAEAAAEAIAALEIYHPYGRVGSLPWQRQAHAVPFGGEVGATKLLELSRQIKTFTEGTDPTNSDIVAIRSLLEKPKAVIFLGFAYHEPNIKLLWPTELSLEHRPCIGTAVGISDDDLLVIRPTISNRSGTQHHLVNLRSDLTCKDIFSHFRQTLAQVLR